MSENAAGICLRVRGSLLTAAKDRACNSADIIENAAIVLVKGIVQTLGTIGCRRVISQSVDQMRQRRLDCRVDERIISANGLADLIDRLFALLLTQKVL
jgi:hypothetical protein